MNLLEFGWKGYDTEAINVPSSAQDGWGVQQSQQLDDDVWKTWGKWPENADELERQEFEDPLQELYPMPYQDPLDDPLFDPEDDP